MPSFQVSLTYSFFGRAMVGGREGGWLEND